jgi:uncharacterized membrane protein YcaP (DUF421 family)
VYTAVVVDLGRRYVIQRENIPEAINVIPKILLRHFFDNNQAIWEVAISTTTMTTLYSDVKQLQAECKGMEQLVRVEPTVLTRADVRKLEQNSLGPERVCRQVTKTEGRSQTSVEYMMS